MAFFEHAAFVFCGLASPPSRFLQVCATNAPPPKKQNKRNETPLVQEREMGIIPRVISELFTTIDQISATTCDGAKVDFSLRVSFLEVYGEQIRDLACTGECGGVGDCEIF